MNTITDKQEFYLRALAAKIEARKVIAPKKISRWNDPIRAHAQQVAKARAIIAELNAGAMTRGAASTYIDTMQLWAKA